jgi:hypothetical protein
MPMASIRSAVVGLNAVAIARPVYVRGCSLGRLICSRPIDRPLVPDRLALGGHRNAGLTAPSYHADMVIAATPVERPDDPQLAKAKR